MKLLVNSDIWNQAAAFSIRYKVFVVEQAIAKEEEFDAIDQSQPIYAVIYDQNLPVATARLVIDNEKTCRVSRVATLEEYRGQGYGSQVVQAIESCGLKEGFKHCLIHADLRAVPFYQKLGYQICSEIFIEDGVECLLVDKHF